MTVIEYTKDYDEYESSTVEDILYNANTRTALVAPRGEYYAYSDVDESDVEVLIDADSVGAEYTNFKRTFGPGTYLQRPLEFKRVDVRPVAATVATPQNWTVSDNAVIDGSSITAPNVSLSLAPNTNATSEATSLPTRVHTVNYRLHDNDIERQYTLDAVGVESAVQGLVDALAPLNITPIATTVVTYL